MPLIAPTLPTLGELNATEDPDTRNTLQTIVNAINGQLDKDNILDGGLTADELTATVLAALGLSSTGVARRGKTNIATIETTASTTYTKLATPDQVSGLVLPSDGLLIVGLQALWKASVASNGRAALFLGASQVTRAQADGAPAVMEVSSGGTPNLYAPLTTSVIGLNSTNSSATDSSDVATGQLVATSGALGNGGLAFIWAAAGTYDLSLQFKNVAAGSLTVKNRHLWALALGF